MRVAAMNQGRLSRWHSRAGVSGVMKASPRFLRSSVKPTLRAMKREVMNPVRAPEVNDMEAPKPPNTGVRM